MEKTFKKILNNENFKYICENKKITFAAVYEGKKWQVLIAYDDNSFSIYCFYPWEASKYSCEFCNTQNLKLREGKFIYDERLGKNIFHYGRNVFDEYTKYEVCEYGLKLAMATIVAVWYEFYNFIHKATINYNISL